MDKTEMVLQRAYDSRMEVWGKAFMAISDVINDVAKDLHTPLGAAIYLTDSQAVMNYREDAKIYDVIYKLEGIQQSLAVVYADTHFPEEEALIRHQAYQEIRKAFEES